MVCSRFSLERKEVNVKTLLSIKFVWNLEISVRIGKSCLKQNFKKYKSYFLFFITNDVYRVKIDVLLILCWIGIKEIS